MTGKGRPSIYGGVSKKVQQKMSKDKRKARDRAMLPRVAPAPAPVPVVAIEDTESDEYEPTVYAVGLYLAEM